MTHDNSNSSAQALQALQGALILEITPIMPDQAADKIPFLTKEAASTLATQIGGDLEKLFPELHETGIILPGAVYDQTELLAPGFPLYRALEEMYLDAGGRDNEFEAQIISLGSVDGEFPIDVLRPAPSLVWGPLMVIPFSLVAPVSHLAPIEAEFDQRMFEHGSCSEATIEIINEQFGLTTLHAQYLSLSSLCALTRAHLNAAGLDFLWELLEKALTDPHGSTEVNFNIGLTCRYHDQHVTLPFYSYREWVKKARDQKTERPEGQSFVEGYSLYVRQTRQASIGLGAHSIDVVWEDAHGSSLEGAFFCETDDLAVDGEATTLPEIVRATLIEQHDPDLGTVAWVVGKYDSEDRLIQRLTYYPLITDGLKSALEAAEALAASYPSVTRRKTESLETTADETYFLDE